MGPISVLFVDDHPVFADAMQARLAAEPDVSHVSVAYSGREAITRVTAESPSVVVLDLKLGGESGLDVAEALRTLAPSTRVVMLSAADSLDSVLKALRLGVRGWLPKTVDIEEVVAAVRAVAAGEAWLSRRLLGQVLDRLFERDDDPEDNQLTALTTREREVLDCIARGLNRSQTAAELGISLNTVRTHTQSVIAKLGVHSALEAVAIRNRAVAG